MPPESKHAHVADTIRARIGDGTYGYGLPLPSEEALREEFGYGSRAPIRAALQQLADEGLVHAVHRRGWYVQPPRPKRRINPDRYREELAAARQDLDAALNPAGLPPATVTGVPADDTLAALFGVPPGTLLLRRYWLVRTADGVAPEQMTTSYLPDVEAARACARLQAAGGVMAYLLSTGQEPTRVVELWTSRPPTDEEARVLQVGSSWVLATTRLTYCGDRVVEVGREIVVSAQGTEVVNEIILQRSS